MKKFARLFKTISQKLNYKKFFKNVQFSLQKDYKKL